MSKKLKVRLTVLFASLFALGALRVAARYPTFVEGFWVPCLSVPINLSLAFLTGRTECSVFELLAAVLLVVAAACCARGALRVRRGSLSVGRALGGAALNVAVSAAVLLCWFELAWGLNYDRLPISARLGWHSANASPSAADPGLLSAVAQAMVRESNFYRSKFAGCGDIDDWAEMDAELDAAFAGAFRRLGLPQTWPRRLGRAKPLHLSFLLSRLGIAGIYIPWTAEASLNRQVPSCQLPLSMAHEKAHQRGIASEDEANFVGFIACLESGDDRIRYSGFLFAQRQLLSELFRHRPDEARLVASHRDALVTDDIRKADAFWRSRRGPATRVGEAVNNVYLRSQGVREGVRSYRLSVRLLIEYAQRERGWWTD